MLPTYLINAFLQTQERRGSTEKHSLSKLSPPIVFIVRQFQAPQALGFHLIQQHDQMYIKLLGFLMPTLGPLFSSLPSLDCLLHSQCLYLTPLLEHPIQDFQFQWMHIDFYDLSKWNSISALYFSDLKVLPSITSPISFDMSRGNISLISQIMYTYMRNL